MTHPPGTTTVETTTPPARTAPERTLRARSVAEARARGEAWSPIAERHGIDVRTARRDRDLWLRHAAAMAPLDENPNVLIREAVAHHRAALVDLERLSTEGNNASAKVGAARARAETSRALLALFRDAGQVPDARGVRFANDVGHFTRAVAEICRRRGIPLTEVLTELESVPGFSRALEAAP